VTYQVLVYPNITYGRDLGADSYVVAVRSMIRALNAVRDDLEFTMLLPEPVRSLRFPNVRHVHYPLPRYPNTMRTSFDAPTFVRAIDWRARSYDVVWSHLPEHTLQIANVFANATNERPVIVGYAHWFEVAENSAYAETMLPANLHGILAMRECGVNSTWLRDLVIDRASHVVAPPLVASLATRLSVQHLGVDPLTIVPEPMEHGLVVFNHRANSYTGFPAACQMFDSMWKRRHDFRVAFTLTNVDAPWATRIHATTRDDYLRELSRANVGVGAFRTYSAWSVAVMDGLSVGVPYVLPNRLCYPEMVGPAYPWLYDDDADMGRLIESVVDNRNEWAIEDIARGVARRYAWVDMIKPINAMFDRAIAAIPVATVTPTYERLRRMARAHVRPSKAALTKAMGWGGPRVPWTPYRHRLRCDGIDLVEPEPAPQQLEMV